MSVFDFPANKLQSLRKRNDLFYMHKVLKAI